MKKTIFYVLPFIILFLFLDIFSNLLNLRPVLWKNSFYSYLNVNWYTWHGADHLYKNEIHSKQTNGYKTRGLKTNKNFSKNIILLGDSSVETSKKINEMPERYLRDNFSNTNIISFASWGWSNDQQLLHLKDNIEEIKPEKVILWFEINDVVGNSLQHGFLGRKPLFKLKEKENKFILDGPDLNPGKNYFEYSYFYRAVNKINILLKEKYPDINPTCQVNHKYDNKQKFLKSHFNLEKYNKDKKIKSHYEKPYVNLTEKVIFPNFLKWQENMIKNSELSFASILKHNLEIKTKEMIYNEKLTNKILSTIQELVIKNNSEFYVFFINEKSRYKPFDLDKKYTFCHNNKEIYFSNKAFDEKLNKVFKGIKNLKFINLEEDFGKENYDLFDSHKNNKANKFIMDEVFKFINK